MLLIFFHDRGWLQSTNRISQVDSNYHRASSPTPTSHTTLSEVPNKISARATHQFEFLLFSYLLRFVHREGRLGDFARAGLIFLFDIAFLTPGEEGGENLSSGPVKDGPDPLQEARDALGEFILDGDFADVMAAALGAVYSLLPTKLQVPSISSQEVPEEDTKIMSSGGMHLGSGMKRQDEEDDIQLSTDLHVQTQLDLLLKLFGFLQDIIRRCNSPILYADPNSSVVTATHVLGGAIAGATLDAIHSSFLDNVLYPSLLECSSHDGSSVAVLTYLDVLFSNLDDGPIVDRVLSFLLDTELSGTTMPLWGVNSKSERQETGAMRFVSQKPFKSTEYFASEGRFTLKDLILDNLCSGQRNSVTAALCLLQTLLSDHPNQATRGLLSYIHEPAATALVCNNPVPRSLDFQPPDAASFVPNPKPVNFTDAHFQEVELYGSLLSRLDPLQTSIEMSPGYVGYLADMQTALESNPLFGLAQTLPFMDEEIKGETLNDKIGVNGGGNRLDREDPIPHKLNPADPLLRAVLFEFEKFLCKTADENVAMTGVLTAIAQCPYRGLGGWLLYEKEAAAAASSSSSSQRDNDDPWAASVGEGGHTTSLEDKSDSDSSSNLSLSSQHAPDEDRDPFAAPSPSPSSSSSSSVDLPVIYQILQSLVKQISLLRTQVPQFDRLLSERRQGLLFADHLNEAMNIMLDVDQTAASSVFGSPAKSGSSLLMTKRKGRGSAALGLGLGSGLAGSIKSFLTPKKKGGGHHTSEMSGTPDEPGSTTPRLGFGLGFPGFSSTTPTKSPSPLPLPTPPVASASASASASGSGTGTGMNLNSSSPSLSSAEPTPFKAHYDQTRQPVSLPLYFERGEEKEEGGRIVAGPWGGRRTKMGVWRGRGKRPELIDLSGVRGEGGGGDGDVSFSFSMDPDEIDRLVKEEEEDDEEEGDKWCAEGTRQVSLSTVLDNCVILEEFLKETVALIVARRMLGVDQVGFI